MPPSLGSSGTPAFAQFWPGIESGHYLTALDTAEEFSHKGGRAKLVVRCKARGLLRYSLLAVEFNDQLLVDRKVDVLTLGQSKHLAAETGVSVNTLLSRKRYAVLHLRERLQNIYNEFMNK